MYITAGLGVQSIPLALVHPIFAEFLEALAGQAEAPQQNDYEMAVSG